jgi:pimeloyl-ACP methyl ester carboxylesterase
MHSVILLPGLACDGELFDHQAQALRDDGHTVCISDAHSRFESIPEMAAAILAEWPGPQVLIGCSMGGMLAMEIARQAPSRMRAIALLGSSARPDTPELITLRRRACELFAAGRMDEVLGANVMLAFHPGNALNRALVAGYLAMIGRAGPSQLIRQNRAVMARIDSLPSMAQWRWSTLVLCGEADGQTPPAQAREMAAAVPGAQLHLVPGAGHMLTLEQPQRVTALLQGWLASIKDRVSVG